MVTKNVLSQVQYVALADKLRLHCRTVDGHALYEDGWDDQRVADESDGVCTVHNVQGLRKALLGDLPKRVRPGTLEGCAAALAALEERVARSDKLLRRVEVLEASVVALQQGSDGFTKVIDESSRGLYRLETWAGHRPVDPFPQKK